MKTSPFQIAALLVPLLLSLGYGKDLPRIRTVSLTGATAELGNLEGRWFDADGNLIVEISGGRNPRLAMRLSSWLDVTDAHVTEGKVSFRIQTDRSAEPGPSCLDRVGRNEIEITPLCSPDAERPGCGLGIEGRRESRAEPTPLWVMKHRGFRGRSLASPAPVATGRADNSPDGTSTRWSSRPRRSHRQPVPLNSRQTSFRAALPGTDYLAHPLLDLASPGVPLGHLLGAST
jgi:hypothetical protein